MPTPAAGPLLPPGAARLPPELCDQVIDNVAGYYDLHDSVRTLLACSLTCRSWVGRARRHLYRFGAVAKTRTQFAALLQRLEAQPGLLETRVLDVGYDRDPAQAPAQTWVGTVPGALARRLAHVRRLRLACVPPVLHRSFYVVLAQFRALTGLLLHGCAFPHVKDFARLVLGFRSLVQLYLSRLEWPVERKAGAHAVACRGMKRMAQLRLEVLNITISPPHVMVDACNWLLYTSSGSSLHTISIDFPAVEPRALVPDIVARLLRTCGPTLRNLRMRFDSVLTAADCAQILCGLSLEECKQFRTLSTRALPPDQICIDALTNLVNTLPSDTSVLEDVSFWYHGKHYFQGFPWTALDQALSDKTKHPRFKKLAVTVRQSEDAAILAPLLYAAGKLALYETDSDHGEQFRFW
ncbi:hypothetical protein PsYK624_044660 [Phanerochaete sordida]|uniref:F-box domain-containing protein n=1 Tax=Phanerochaete sordida TaxID=48140 RepID=A0A9P3G3F1_9APHY|nr:hypothetical protein PsYK624_044660 [Phanerochaete sordida]